MGRELVLVLLHRGLVTNFCWLVLHEIEEEDSLWHQKSKDQEPDQQSQSKEQQVENSQKDPVMPAEGAGNEEPPANSPSRRKINFF